MSTATATAPTTALPKNDFPDWLSPIVVKELRQGLKSRAFVSVATLLQGGMAFMFVIAALSAMSPGGSGVDTLSGFFWFMLWVPLIFVMPGRALQAVVEETKVQTLELVQMTRMQSLRIILGKWCALSVQSFLLVLAILPYFVLRYFFGGVDLVNDLINLLSLLGLSMLFTAAGLAASTLKPGLRIVLVIISVAFVLIGGQALAIMSSFGRGGPLGGMAWPASPWLGLLAGCLLLTAYVSFFLLQGADHLSTQVESYSPQKRVLALISSLVIITAWVLHDQTSIDLRILSLLIPLVLWSIAEALVEVNDPDWVLGRRQPFWNFFFRPGWATGLFFSWVILGILFVGIYLERPSFSREEFEGAWKSYLICVGAVLTPALILIRMAWVKQRLLLYWLIQLLFAVAFTGAMIMSTRPGLRPEDALAYLAPLPPSIALGLIQQEMDIGFVRTVFPITASVTVAIMSLFLIFALRALRRSRAHPNLTS